MLRVLAGANTLEMIKSIKKIRDEIGVDPIEIKVEKISYSEFYDLIFAQSLFANSEFLIARNLSSNKPVWEKLIDLIPKIAEDQSLNLVLIETELDKRTKIAKELMKMKFVTEFNLPKEYDSLTAKRFILKQANDFGVKISDKLAQEIYERVGSDPWSQYHALEILSAIDGDITFEIIDKYIAKTALANVFSVIELALKKDVDKLNSLIDELERISTEPNQFFGLIVSQVLILLAIKSAPVGSNIAKDISVNPYALDKLRPLAIIHTLESMTKMVKILALADRKFKSSQLNPWTVIKSALNEIAKI